MRLRVGRCSSAPTAPFAGIDAGYGLGLIRLKNLIGHTGAINGGGAVMWRLPEQDATFVVMVNASSNVGNVADAIATAR